MARKKYVSDRYCYNVAFPLSMKSLIKEAARANHRSMNNEIVFRLQKSFELPEEAVPHSEPPEKTARERTHEIQKESAMNNENIITLDQLRSMPLEQVAALPPAQLAGLVDEVAAVLQEAKMTKAFLDGALDHRFGGPVTQLRQAEGKPTGVIRLREGDFTVVCDLPKKPVWDQEKLATIAEEIRRDGVNPADYLDTVYKVQERRFTAWPPHIQQAFQAARILKVGKPTYRLERPKPEGGF